MGFDNLTKENILLYLIKAYNSPNLIMSEFEQDMKRFDYLKKLFSRYRTKNELRIQLILNHIVVLYNVLGPEVVIRSLFYKVTTDDYSTVKTFLLFLNLMPNTIRGINGININSSDIPVDTNIAIQLRELT